MAFCAIRSLSLTDRVDKSTTLAQSIDWMSAVVRRAVQREWRGLAAVAGVAAAASAAPLATAPLAVAGGALLRLALPTRTAQQLDAGAQRASRSVLRAGIVCVGAKLSLAHALALGAAGAPLVGGFACATAGTALLLARALRVERPLAALVAGGAAICGVTAVSAIAPVVRAREAETVAAVSGVVVFGSAGMLLLPHVAPLLFASSEQIGLFLALGIHDTSQVMCVTVCRCRVRCDSCDSLRFRAAAATYAERFADPVVLQTAATLKLTRNLFLAAAVPFFGWFVAREEHKSRQDKSESQRLEFFKYVPTFLYGFLAMAAARAVGDAVFLNDDKRPEQAQTWKRVTDVIGTQASGTLLSVALAGVGLQTSFAAMRSVGGRALLLSGLSSLAALSFAALCARYAPLPRQRKSE